jgi:hypothetical protein
VSVAWQDQRREGRRVSVVRDDQQLVRGVVCHFVNAEAAAGIYRTLLHRRRRVVDVECQQRAVWRAGAVREDDLSDVPGLASGYAQMLPRRLPETLARSQA